MPVVRVQGFGDLDVPEGWTLLEACEADPPMDAACGRLPVAIRVSGCAEGGDSLSPLQRKRSPSLKPARSSLGVKRSLVACTYDSRRACELVLTFVRHIVIRFGLRTAFSG